MSNAIDLNMVTGKTLLRIYSRLESMKKLHQRKLEITAINPRTDLCLEDIVSKVIDRAWKTHELEIVKNKITSVINKLSEKHQTVILKFYLQNLTQDKIAKSTGHHIRTTQRQLDRAVELFSQSLQPEFNTFIINDLMRNHIFFRREYHHQLNTFNQNHPN